MNTKEFYNYIITNFELNSRLCMDLILDVLDYVEKHGDDKKKEMIKDLLYSLDLTDEEISRFIKDHPIT